MHILKRIRGADTVDESRPWRIGLSMAATWSWGVAIAVSIAILHTRGLIPYIFWGVANVISIAFFGKLYEKFPSIRKWKYLWPFVLLWGFIGIFAIIINMSTIHAVLGGAVNIKTFSFFSANISLAITIGIGLFIAWFIHKFGFFGSLHTDVWQYALQLIAAIALCILGLMSTDPAAVELTAGGQVSWIISGFLGLLMGPIACGMQWQRIEQMSSPREGFKASLWGSGVFLVFLFFGGIGAYFYTGTLAQSIVLLIVSLAITTSTADSGSAVLQYASQRFKLGAKTGSLLTVAGVILFPFFHSWGLSNIWSFYAGIRWKMIVVLMILTVLFALLSERQQDSLKGSFSWLTIPDNILE